MLILGIGVFLLVVSFVSHLIVWRVWRPRNHMLGLLLVFTTVPIVLAGAYMSFAPATLSLWEMLHIGMFYTIFSLIYFTGYSALTHDSILLATYAQIEAAGENGVSKEMLSHAFHKDVAPMERLALMEKSYLVRLMDDCYVLTSKGKWIARLFAMSEQLFGLPKGG